MRYPTTLAIVRASWEARMDRQQRKPRVRAAEYGPRAQVSHPVVRRSLLASAGTAWFCTNSTASMSP